MFTPNVIPSTVALIIGIAGLLIFSLITIITKKKANEDIKFEIAACVAVLLGTVLLFVTQNFLFLGISLFIYSVLTFLARKKPEAAADAVERHQMVASCPGAEVSPDMLDMAQLVIEKIVQDEDKDELDREEQETKATEKDIDLDLDDVSD